MTEPTRECIQCRRVLPLALFPLTGGWRRKKCRACHQAGRRAREKELREHRLLVGDVCPVEGCGRPLYARGYCQGHYRQEYRYGRIEPVSPLTVKDKPALLWRGLMDAFAAYEGADTDSQFADATMELHRAARRWGNWCHEVGRKVSDAAIASIIEDGIMDGSGDAVPRQDESLAQGPEAP